MSKALNDDILCYAKELFETGNFNYHQIAQILQLEFNVEVADDTLRYHLVRKDKPKLTNVEKLLQDGISKKLILSDLHIPFQREDILDIVDKHKDEIDEIIINGDLIDCAEISVFTDLGKMPLIEEMIATHKLLKDIDNITPNIKKKINYGNHEFRWRRYLANTGTSLNSLHSSNILKEICGGFTNYDHRMGIETRYNELPNYEVIDDWWFQLNDVIICHPITFSKIKARTATLTAEYFIQQGLDFSAVLVAHTHKHGMVEHYCKIAIETGCLCLPMGYSSSGKVTYTPQEYGYYLATFKDNKLDVNESRLYFLK